MLTVPASCPVSLTASNQLTLNYTKSKILILGSSPYIRNINHNTLPPITINSHQLPFVHDAKNLGVIISFNLFWRSHVSHISRKVHNTLHKLKYHRNALSIDLQIKLITILVFPHLDYCCLVYHNLTAELNIKLQQLINCCIRFIYNLRRDVHITPYGHQLKWLSVKEIEDYTSWGFKYFALCTAPPHNT